MAPKIAPALRVEAKNGLIRRCECAPCRQAWLCFAPSLSPFLASTRARPQARQPPSGNRPGFTGAAEPQLGRALYDTVLRLARERHHNKVAAGVFGANMQISLVNDGPVTIPLRLF